MFDRNWEKDPFIIAEGTRPIGLLPNSATFDRVESVVTLLTPETVTLGVNDSTETLVLLAASGIGMFLPIADTAIRRASMASMSSPYAAIGIGFVSLMSVAVPSAPVTGLTR